MLSFHGCFGGSGRRQADALDHVMLHTECVCQLLFKWVDFQGSVPFSNTVSVSIRMRSKHGGHSGILQYSLRNLILWLKDKLKLFPFIHPNFFQ